MAYFTGLDISMKSTEICVLDQEGVVLYQKSVPTDPKAIADSLSSFPSSRVGLESGSLSFWLVEELEKLGVQAICIDARKMSHLLRMQINKTDKNDAKAIARAMQSGLYTPVHIKSKESCEIATLIKTRALLIKQRLQTSNTVRGFFKNRGIRLESLGAKRFIEVSLAQCKGLALPLQLSIKGLVRLYQELSQEIDQLSQALKEISQKDKVIQRLMTMPGVGLIIAALFKAEIDDPKRFEKSSTVGAYLGMTPKEYSSGESRWLGSISKQGSREMRTLLAEGGLVVLTRCKKWSRLKAWGHKLEKKHGLKKASVAVGRKMGVMMHRMWLEEKDFIYGKDKQKRAA